MTPDIHSGGGLVLQTKLHSPPLPTDLVERVKLIELLDRERTRPLTLVSAPAGYGKSVLVANWLEHSDWPSAWYSLDVDDGDLRVFLTYIVAALRTMFSGVCEQTLNLTKASELPSMSTLSTVLSNELDAIEQPFFLVLDDYHRIDAQSPVHELLENLLAHPPIPLHLVIVTRFDPPLSLERHRALAQVADIRLLDLRLSVPETRLLLQKSAHFDASETELANLDQELEGWVVGLKLAALALRRASSPDELLTQFRAGNREIRAYLIGEVLSTLPQDERDRLSRIALLDRFCAPLCDAICARTDGQTLLQSLLHENLFVIPLDISGQWYRFHHLFQELLQRELATQLDAREIEALHLTASRWFEAHDFIDEAIRHALAARDDLAAVEIVERHRHRELNADRWYVIERWLEMLPTIKEQRPNLLLARAWIAYERLDVVGLATIVERTLELLDEQDQGTPLWGELQYLRGAAFYWSGEGERSHECCLIARTCLPQEHQIWLGLTHMLIGVSSHMCGNTNQAIDGLRRELQRASPSQSMYFTRLLSGLCFTYTTAGDLIRARSEAVRMESVATQGKNQYTAAWGSYIQAFTFLHGYDLQQAADKFANAMEHRYILHRMAAVDSFAGLALCQQLMDQPDAAKRTTQALHDFALELGEPIYLEIALSCEARMAVLQGSPTDALVWAGGNIEPPQFAEMFMWLEVPALTRARVWVALGTDESLELACDLLEEIVSRSRSWNLVNQLVEAGALRCLTLHRLGRLEEADECLTDTLRLAAPGGWVRPFLEQGRAMAALMARLEKQHKISDFGRHVMSMFKVESAPQPQNTAGRGSLIHGNGEVIDTLTNRELAILELLAQRLQNKEIARRLFVSPETVKSHMKRLFHKLDVNNRRDAAAMAIQMFASSDAADH